MNKDVLREFLERLIEACQQQDGFDEAVARSVERQLRHEYGGEQVLIRKDPDREARREAARQDLRRGLAVPEVQQKHGISRSSVYELLKKRS